MKRQSHLARRFNASMHKLVLAVLVFAALGSVAAGMLCWIPPKKGWKWRLHGNSWFLPLGPYWAGRLSLDDGPKHWALHASAGEGRLCFEVAHTVERSLSSVDRELSVAGVVLKQRTQDGGGMWVCGDMSLGIACGPGIRPRMHVGFSAPGWYPAVALSAYPMWMLIRGPGLRHRRRRRNQCLRCGYDLTGNVSGVCPECGTPVPPGGTTT